jgi:hypothetical protein
MIEARKNQINIKDLTLESPKTAASLPFDFEKEISREDKDHMRAFLKTAFEDYRKSPFINEINYFLATAFVMNIIDPGLLTDIDLTKADHERFMENAKDDVIVEQAKHFGRIKALFPGEKSPIRYTQINLNFELYKFGGDRSSIIERNMPHFFILFPKEIKQLSDDQDLKDVMDTRIEEFRTQGFGDEILYAETARNIIFGHGKSVLTERDFDNYCGEMYNAKKQGAWRTFAESAAILKLHSAIRISMTENGLHITLPKTNLSNKKNIQNIPQRRRF